MFNFELKIPTYKEWKVNVEKYQEQVLTFWKDFFNDIWIHTPSGK